MNNIIFYFEEGKTFTFTLGSPIKGMKHKGKRPYKAEINFTSEPEDFEDYLNSNVLMLLAVVNDGVYINGVKYE